MLLSAESAARATLRDVQDRLAGSAQEEWDRLQATAITRTEYHITRHCLNCYLPAAGLVLDAGCGPGRYAVDLARQGYEVVMLDLMPEHLRFAQAQIARAGIRGEAAVPVQGDLVLLPCESDIFDAVLCLGAPLSYLLEASARTRAIADLARVARPGGRLLITGIGRIASYRGAIYWGNLELFDLFTSPEARRTGHTPDHEKWYTFAPRELEGLAQSAGLSVVDSVGCEGLAAYLPMDHLEQVERDPERWPVWQEILFETCNEPTIVGMSSHLLVVAEKAA